MKGKKIILRLVVLIVTLVLLFYIVDIKTFFDLLNNGIPLKLYLLVIIIALLRTYLNGIRWKILNVNTTKQPSNWDYFRYMMITNTYNLILPGVLGGDIVKAIWIRSDDKSNKGANTISILSDRIVGMLSLVILTIVAMILSDFFEIKIKIIVISVLSILLILFFTIPLLLNKKNILFAKKSEGKRNSKFINAVLYYLEIIIDTTKYFVRHPVIVIKALLLSFIIHIAMFIINFLIAKSIGINISIIEISIVSCIVWIITVIPISISGLGVRELSFIGVLSLYAVSNEKATLLSLYIFSIAIALAIIGLPFLLTRKNNSNGR
jgi:glycosyltransferase 2 family protein